MTIRIVNAVKKRKAQSCPECRSQRIAEREEHDVCLDCGFVISPETIKVARERKMDVEGRIQPVLQSTKPSNCGNTSYDNIASVLERWKQVKIGDAAEKNLALSLQFITKIAIDLSLPKTALEKASSVYKEILRKRLLKGRSMRILAATAVYIGCKQCGIAITTKKVAYASKTSPQKITRGYRMVMKQISFEIHPTSANACATELSARLQVSAQPKQVIEKIVEALQHSKSLAGKDPTGVGAAAVYLGSMLCGEKITQRKIAEEARITEQTIRARCREIERKLKFSLFL